MKIYYINIAGIKWDDLSKYVPLCEEERIQAIEQAKKESQKIKGTISGLLLRYAYQNWKGKEEKPFFKHLPIKYNEYGKPYIENTNFKFSISHAGDYVFLCEDQDNVGIDVEQVLKNRKVLAMAKRFFTEDEYKRLLSIDKEQERDFEFTRIWTQKECYMKFVGQGLSYGMAGFYVNAEGYFVDSKGIQEKRRCIEFDLLDGYCISVCYLEKEEQKNVEICKVTEEFLLN